MKMIKLSSDHYIVVDDSKIKGRDWVFNEKSKEIYPITIIEEVVYYEKKITHSTQPLGKPMLFTNAFESDLAITTMGLHDTVIENWGCKKLSLSEIKELLGEVDVEKKAQIQWGNVHRTGVLGYIDGYNQCLEDNKDKKYTEEDMQWALHHVTYHQELTIEQIIEALHQPKTEWEVEIVDGKLKLKQ